MISGGIQNGRTITTIGSGPIPKTDTAPTSGAFLLVAVCAFIVAVWIRKRGLK